MNINHTIAAEAMDMARAVREQVIVEGVKPEHVRDLNRWAKLSNSRRRGDSDFDNLNRTEGVILSIAKAMMLASMGESSCVDVRAIATSVLPELNERYKVDGRENFNTVYPIAKFTLDTLIAVIISDTLRWQPRPTPEYIQRLALGTCTIAIATIDDGLRLIEKYGRGQTLESILAMFGESRAG